MKAVFGRGIRGSTNLNNEKGAREIIKALMPKGYAQTKELIEALGDRPETETDFTLAFDGCEYRCISKAEIDLTMSEELLSDLYVLGCCSDWFIADMCGLDITVVQDAQKAESFELLGALMANNIDEVQDQMVRHDGYGHHFNHWDGSEIETPNFYLFRVS